MIRPFIEKLNACETGETAGGLGLHTPGGFFQKLAGALLGHSTPSQRRRGRFEALTWLITFELHDGTIATKAVRLNGGNLHADTEVLARIALAEQHCIECAAILRIALDLRATPARIEALEAITSQYNRRARFEAECG